jgi:hypothetical protein
MWGDGWYKSLQLHYYERLLLLLQYCSVDDIVAMNITSNRMCQSPRGTASWLAQFWAEITLVALEYEIWKINYDSNCREE